LTAKAAVLAEESGGRSADRLRERGEGRVRGRPAPVRVVSRFGRMFAAVLQLQEAFGNEEPGGPAGPGGGFTSRLIQGMRAYESGLKTAVAATVSSAQRTVNVHL
jgi:hypothetical protein